VLLPEEFKTTKAHKGKWLNFLMVFVISYTSPPDYKPCPGGHLNVVQDAVSNRGLTHYPITKEEMQDDEKVSMGTLG
jgi:hypothetical protein